MKPGPTNELYDSVDWRQRFMDKSNFVRRFVYEYNQELRALQAEISEMGQACEGNKLVAMYEKYDKLKGIIDSLEEGFQNA